MQYTVVHSKDPYLLARLATELQMSGVKYRNNSFDAFHEVIDYIHIEADNTFSFQAHGWCPNTLPEDRHELTSLNYISVLTQILEPGINPEAVPEMKANLDIIIEYTFCHDSDAQKFLEHIRKLANQSLQKATL